MNFETPKRWKIGDFYRKSWDLTLRHKKLWILALLLAVGSSGGNGGSSGSSSSSEKDDSTESVYEENVSSSLLDEDIEELDLYEAADTNNEEVLDDSDKILSSATIAKLDRVFDKFMEKDLKTPPVLFAIAFFFLQFLVFLAWAIVFGIVLKSWATASLIIGIDDAFRTDKVNLSDICARAMHRIKAVAWVTVVPGLLFFIAFLVSMVIGAILIALLQSSPLLIVLLSIIAVFGVIVATTALLTATIWGVRHASLSDASGKDSFMMGRANIKGNINRMFSLGLANTISSGLAVLAVLVPFGSVGIATAIPMIQNRQVDVYQIVILVLVFVSAIPVLSLTSAALNVFKYATWNLAFYYLQSKGSK